LRYAQCMRAHGVPGFPDPSQGGATELSKSTVNSPQFQSASQACQSLVPGGAPQGGGSPSPQMQSRFLSFARCMRAHGVPDFPDPTFSGSGVSVPLPNGASNSPQFHSATQACRSLLPSGTGAS
jgi:hypothetical protein